MTILYCPGPIDLPDIVKDALVADIPYFGSDKFGQLLQTARAGLQEAFFTKNPILFSTGSGSFLMEACISNFLSNKSKVVFLNSGRYGNNWIQCATAYGLRIKELKSELTSTSGKAIALEQIEAWLQFHPDVEGVFCQHVESTTGIKNNIQEISLLVKKYTNALFFVDAISSFFAEEIKVDDWGLDVVITASQKGLSLPPGLGMMVVNSSALNRARRSDLPKYYFDVKEEYIRQIEKNQTRFTPAVHIIYALSKVLEHLTPISTHLNNAFQKAAFHTDRIQKAYNRLGIIPYSDTSNNTVQVGVLPNEISVSAFFKQLEDDYNIYIGKGQDLLRERGIRIKSFGWDASFSKLTDVITAVGTALENNTSKGT